MEWRGLGQAWQVVVKTAQWRNLVEVRKVFPSADAVKVVSGRQVTIFNIGGNKYRLICGIHYNRGIIFMLRFMTHAPVR